MNFGGIFDRKRYERIVCADGASVSIQAGEGIYCTPRNNIGPYTHIEAGFPSVEPPASWLPHAEDVVNLCDTVYGYMPYERVDEFIEIHGGMVSGELPQRDQE